MLPCGSLAMFPQSQCVHASYWSTSRPLAEKHVSKCPTILRGKSGSALRCYQKLESGFCEGVVGVWIQLGLRVGDVRCQDAVGGGERHARVRASPSLPVHQIISKMGAPFWARNVKGEQHPKTSNSASVWHEFPTVVVTFVILPAA